MTTPPDILAAAEAAYLNPCSISGTDRDFIQSIAAAIEAERERCARIAEQFTGAQHAAHDMAAGIFLRLSNMGEAVAAAIRKG